VVGVVGDVRHAGLATPPEPAMYLPYTQAPAPTWPILHRSLVVVTRTADDPRAHVAALKEAVLQIDPSLPLADDNTLDEYVDHAQATTRSTMLLLSSLGALALLLASVGVYGAVSYFVSQRRQEIGVRMALGATPRRIWRLVLVRAMAPVGGGALVGIAIALAATRILQGQLYGVATTDPPTLVAVTVLLVGVGVIAAYVPARRAMRLPPASALQSS
jgi:ABC-type antimicrobial peptide transport system permease subunit